jgi:hypothetical protein
VTNGITATIDVSQLVAGLPAITPAFGETLVEAIAVCFDNQDYVSGDTFAVLAIDCGEFQMAERLITRALAENPPAEIAAELKDLFVQINLPQYFERRGLHFDMQRLTLSDIA